MPAFDFDNDLMSTQLMARICTLLANNIRYTIDHIVDPAFFAGSGIIHTIISSIFYLKLARNYHNCSFGAQQASCGC